MRHQRSAMRCVRRRFSYLTTVSVHLQIIISKECYADQAMEDETKIIQSIAELMKDSYTLKVSQPTKLLNRWICSRHSNQFIFFQRKVWKFIYSFIISIEDLMINIWLGKNSLNLSHFSNLSVPIFSLIRSDLKEAWTNLHTFYQ